MKKHLQVPIAAALLLIVFAVAIIIYNEQQAEELSATADKNAALLIRDYSPTIGNKNARVTIVEFFDPACETCKAFHPFVKHLMSAHPGRINLVLRYTPFHQGSDYVIKILEAARLQNRFWETLEASYESQPAWASHGNPQPERLWTLLGGVGLDLNKARADMQSPTIAHRIQQDMEDARQLQVTKTPGFFVNGKPLVRFGYEPLQELVEAEIRQQY
ncbi:MAG: thioredoxin domain-containing protein [Gammaproteobacteria bacterium]|nr:thioredoxin domain-containing protein [Gammaproteobacteria bacterium]